MTGRDVEEDLQCPHYKADDVEDVHAQTTEECSGWDRAQQECSPDITCDHDPPSEIPVNPDTHP